MKIQPKLGDKNYDPLRINKTKPPPGTKRGFEIANFYIALNMIKQFKYLPWMSLCDVIGPKGERINQKGETYMPKFKRKK